MSDDRPPDRPPIPPQLHAEWRIVVRLASGSIVRIACDSEDDCRATLARVRFASIEPIGWMLERRLATPWSSYRVKPEWLPDHVRVNGDSARDCAEPRRHP